MYGQTNKQTAEERQRNDKGTKEEGLNEQKKLAKKEPTINEQTLTRMLVMVHLPTMNDKQASDKSTNE